MKVFIVLSDGSWGTELEAVFLDEKKAEQKATELNRQFPNWYHYVLEREVEE